MPDLMFHMAGQQSWCRPASHQPHFCTHRHTHSHYSVEVCHSGLGTSRHSQQGKLTGNVATIVQASSHWPNCCTHIRRQNLPVLVESDRKVDGQSLGTLCWTGQLAWTLIAAVWAHRHTKLSTKRLVNQLFNGGESVYVIALVSIELEPSPYCQS